MQVRNPQDFRALHRFGLDLIHIHRLRFVRPGWKPEPFQDGSDRRWCHLATVASQTDRLYQAAAASDDGWPPEHRAAPDRIWLVAEEID